MSPLILKNIDEKIAQMSICYSENKILISLLTCNKCYFSRRPGPFDWLSWIFTHNDTFDSELQKLFAIFIKKVCLFVNNELMSN